MKKRFVSPFLIAALLVVVLLAAGCNRPDQQAALDTTTPAPAVPQEQQPTLPPAVTPTLSTGEMPGDLAATLAAESGVTPAVETPMPAATQAPAGEVAQPTPIPLATSTPEVAPATASTPAPTTSTGETIHTVQAGERLFSIARLYNVNPYAIAQLNDIHPPYLIYPGEQLKIPSGNVPPATPGPQPTPVAGANIYVVQPGDNLFRIALKFGKSMQAIAAANGIANYNLIFVGQTLRIP
jgi:LysM repeat protein